MRELLFYEKFSLQFHFRIADWLFLPNQTRNSSIKNAEFQFAFKMAGNEIK